MPLCVLGRIAGVYFFLSIIRNAGSDLPSVSNSLSGAFNLMSLLIIGVTVLANSLGTFILSPTITDNISLVQENFVFGGSITFIEQSPSL